MFILIAKLIFGTLFLSCLLTPGVYELLQRVFVFSGVQEFPWPFSRVYDRVAMLSAAGFLWWYRKEFRLGRIKQYFQRGDLGERRNAVLFGVFVSFLSAMLVLPVVVGDGQLIWRDRTLEYYLWKMAKVVPAAILIALIEESFFRVLLFEKLKERFWYPAAAALCSLVYAVVHFIAPVKTYQYSGFGLFVGFEYLGAVLERMLNPALLPAFFGLFFVGMLLCHVIHRTGSLFLCVGLHMGWIAAMKLSNYSTAAAPGFEFPLGVGRRYFLVAEPFVWVSIAIVWVIILMAQKRFKVDPQPV